MFNTPILLLVFNREETAQRVFDAIRIQKPKYFFIAADGPRKNKPGEDEKCQRVRDIIKQVDWDCELKTLFRDNNLGCQKAITTAITWFFEHVEQGIILEDDCLPDPSFFPFCEELLNKYKNDMRIGDIGGNNYFSGIIDNGCSYDFSSYSGTCGWATWRRVWEKFDVKLPFWEAQKNKRSFLFYSLLEKIYFSTFLSDALAGRKNLSVWDTMYVFFLRLHNQLSVCPAVHLVTNIGLGDPNATHTTKMNKTLLVPSSPISFPLKHPEYVLRNKKMDDLLVRKLHFSWKRLVRYFLKLY